MGVVGGAAEAGVSVWLVPREDPRNEACVSPPWYLWHSAQSNRAPPTLPRAGEWQFAQLSRPAIITCWRSRAAEAPLATATNCGLSCCSYAKAATWHARHSTWRCARWSKRACFSQTAGMFEGRKSGKSAVDLLGDSATMWHSWHFV